MLSQIHFILTYMCNFECDHCFLYCSPRSTGTFTTRQVKDVLGQMDMIGTIKQACFEGGEPFLIHPILVESIRLASGRGYDTAIETNTYWAGDKQDAKLWLKPLLEAGLEQLEISDDIFHHGEDAGKKADVVEAAAKEIGLNVSKICINEPRVENEEGQEKGAPIYAGGPKLRGRAVEKLTDGLPKKPWTTFTQCPFEDLRQPKRVHIDAFGHVQLCQGLSMGNMWELPLSELIQKYDPDKHPIAGPLLRGGPAQLAREHDLEHDDGYVDACHMCSCMCLDLIEKLPQYLTPRQVYGLGE